MSKEKIYFKEGNVEVTASRVILGEKNFVLRNISSVQVETIENAWGGAKYVSGLFFVFALLFFMSSDAEMQLVGWVQIPAALLFGAWAMFAKDSYYVQVSSGGTPTNTIKSDSKDLPTAVVEAINNALLDLDDNHSTKKDEAESNSSSDSADEIMKLKGLLDAGAITQEEFDAKKKELLGL